MISEQPKVDLVAKEVNDLINSAKNCIDRGVDPESGKRGTCHVFRESDVCMCEAIDLAKERMN